MVLLSEPEFSSSLGKDKEFDMEVDRSLLDKKKADKLPAF
jgi:hypothetical protein